MLGLDKQKIISRHQRQAGDVGSSEVQIALLTARIQLLTEHLKKMKKDKMAQRGLLQMVGKRRRLLAYLASQDQAAHQKLLKELKLRK